MEIPKFYYSAGMALLNQIQPIVLYIETTAGAPYLDLAADTVGLTCKVFSTAASGPQTVTLYKLTTQPYYANGFYQISKTVMPGMYLFYPDKNLYVGGRIYTYYLSGAADMKPVAFQMVVLPMDIWGSSISASDPYLAYRSIRSISNIDNIEAAIKESALTESSVEKAVKSLSPQAMQLPPEEE